MRLKNQFIDLASILLVLSGIFLRAAGKVAIAMAILWLVGFLFPYVADVVGMPFDNLYAALSALVESIRGYLD